MTKPAKTPKPPKFKWTIEVEVDPIWVEDGFDLNEERAQNIFLRELGFAQSHEVRVQVLKSPKREHIKEIQGYTKGRTGAMKVVDLDTDGNLICEQDGERYNCGETPIEFGSHLLTQAECRMIEKKQRALIEAKKVAAFSPEAS